MVNGTDSARGYLRGLVDWGNMMVGTGWMMMMLTQGGHRGRGMVETKVCSPHGRPLIAWGLFGKPRTGTSPSGAGQERRGLNLFVLLTSSFKPFIMARDSLDDFPHNFFAKGEESNAEEISVRLGQSHAASRWQHGATLVIVADQPQRPSTATFLARWC